MSVRKLIPVEAQDPLDTVRILLRSIWDHAGLDGLVIPVWQDGSPPISILITSPDSLKQADPFAPVMHQNAACLALDIMQNYPDNHLGFVLRPCELRSLIALVKKFKLESNKGLLISSDCLATFPEEDFDWRLETSDHPENMTQSALHFAAQGGLLPSRYRKCCQYCDMPFPEHADISFELFGVATHQNLIINLRSPELIDIIGLEKIKGQPVPNEVNLRREKTLKRLSDWRQQALAYTSAHLSQEHKTLEGLIQHFTACSYCNEMIQQQCPLFESEWITMEISPDPDQIGTWLIACSGCGMCESDCPEGYPLFQSILFIRKTIRIR